MVKRYWLRGGVIGLIIGFIPIPIAHSAWVFLGYLAFLLTSSRLGYTIDVAGFIEHHFLTYIFITGIFSFTVSALLFLVLSSLYEKITNKNKVI